MSNQSISMLVCALLFTNEEVSTMIYRLQHKFVYFAPVLHS